MTINPTQLALGFTLSLFVAAAAYRARSLSTSGAIGSIIDGTIIFGLGGWAWGLLLIAFFVSSSALSIFRGKNKASLAEKFAKTGRRDLAQVLANGGWGAALAIAAAVVGATPERWVFFAAFAGAMAAVNADTWATELGVLSPRPPRLITTGRVAPVGTSGAISLWGLAAAAGGALFIGIAAALLSTLDGGLSAERMVWLITVTLLAGVGGALIDSLLGATVQGIYWCERDHKETEKRIHSCGEKTRLLRGWAWLDNEWVNLLCSIAGSVIAILLWA